MNYNNTYFTQIGQVPHETMLNTILLAEDKLCAS